MYNIRRLYIINQLTSHLHSVHILFGFMNLLSHEYRPRRPVITVSLVARMMSSTNICDHSWKILNYTPRPSRRRFHCQMGTREVPPAASLPRTD